VHSPDGTWIWRIFDSAGRVTAESTWAGKNLVEIRPAAGQTPAGEK
jgi:hypothetical protein